MQWCKQGIHGAPLLGLLAMGSACAADAGGVKVALVETTKAGSPAKSFVATTVIAAPLVEPQEETIADTTGHWRLTPAPAGNRMVKYVVTTDPGPIPFGLGWIVDSLSKDSIPLTLEALRKRQGVR